MAILASEILLIVFFYSVNTETNGQILTVPVELHTTVELPCSQCHICPESTAAVHWYKSSNSDAFLQDGVAVAWWSKRRSGHSQGFEIKEDFSMIVYNITDQYDQDLYRCLVIPVSGAECTHDVKLGIYANPGRSPVIQYTRQTNGFNVTCSVSYVFPMTFPILSTNEGNATTRTYNNTDGTHNTTVTHLFRANENDTIIECLYSNLNFRSIASLRIVDSDTIDQNMTNNTDDTDCRAKPSGLSIVWIILITEVLFFSVIVYSIKTGGVLFKPALRKPIRNTPEDLDRNEHHGENSRDDETVNSTRKLLFGKLYCAVITLTIQIAVLILLVTYLATARCLIKAGGELEGNVCSISMDD